MSDAIEKIEAKAKESIEKENQFYASRVNASGKDRYPFFAKVSEVNPDRFKGISKELIKELTKANEQWIAWELRRKSLNEKRLAIPNTISELVEGKEVMSLVESILSERVAIAKGYIALLKARYPLLEKFKVELEVNVKQLSDTTEAAREAVKKQLTEGLGIKSVSTINEAIAGSTEVQEAEDKQKKAVNMFVIVRACLGSTERDIGNTNEFIMNTLLGLLSD